MYLWWNTTQPWKWKKTMQFEEMWMDLETVTQSEVSQKEKNKYCILMHMATYSSILAWKIPWMEEPGGLQSMGSLRVGHNWASSLSLFPFTHWRRKWQPTPVFLPGEPQGRGSSWAAVYGVSQSWTWLKRFSSSSSSICIQPEKSGIDNLIYKAEIETQTERTNI